MKKLFLLIFLLIAVKAFAQYPRPTGVTAAVSMQGLYKVVGPDTLYWIRTGTGLYIPVGRAADFAAFDRNFKVVGDSVHIADSVYKNNFVFNSAAVSLPALTLISANNDPLNPSDFTIKNYLGQTIFEVGYTGGVFAGSVSNINTGLNSRIDLTTTGTVIERRYTGGSILSLATGTGDFFKFDSLGMYMYHPTDTTTLTKGLVIDPVSGRVYTQTITGGSSTVHTGNGITGTGLVGDPVVLFGDPTFNLVNINASTVFNVGAQLQFQSDDFSGNTSTLSEFTGKTEIRTDRSDGSASAFISAQASTSGTQARFGIQSAGFGGNYQGISVADSSTMIIIDDKNRVGAVAESGIDTAKMTITPKAYVTSEWVLGRIAGSGGSGVSSVSGTASRITSTGGTTPVIDISSTFEALLEKVASKTATASTSTTTYPNWLGVENYVASNPFSFISLTALSATTPIFYNNSTGVISSQAASASQNGYLTSTDWSTFNGKQDALVSGTNIKTINGSPILGSGNLVVGSSVTPVSGETPTGLMNGANVTFTTAHAPISGSLSIIYNGLILQPTIDYTFSGTTATLLLTGHLSGAPISTDYLLFNYQY